MTGNDRKRGASNEMKMAAIPTMSNRTNNRKSLHRQCASINQRPHESYKKDSNKKQKHISKIVVNTDLVPQPQLPNKSMQTFTSIARDLLPETMNPHPESKNAHSFLVTPTKQKRVTEEAMMSGFRNLRNDPINMVRTETGLDLMQYAITQQVSGQLGDIDDDTTRNLLNHKTKNHLFQINNFLDDDDLSFSNHPQYICRQLAGWLRIEVNYVDEWWSKQRKDVLKLFQSHRNNVIKAMGKHFKGMKLCMDIPMLKLSGKTVLLTKSRGLVHLFWNK